MRKNSEKTAASATTSAPAVAVKPETKSVQESLKNRRATAGRRLSKRAQ